MSGEGKPGRVIFIGNIPYGLSEEQITNIFSNVGQVLNFRLVYDQDTGRPKGFGFLEYADTDAAASAVRNLNNYSIMGRELRVDYSHVGGKDESHSQNAQAASAQQPQANGFNAAQQQQQQQQQQQGASGLPALPPGVPLQEGLTAPDQISQTLSSLPPPQLLDILSQMKGLVNQDPAKAHELFRQAPQLAYAIFQALLLMGLVDHSALSSVIESAAQPSAPTPVPAAAQPVMATLPSRPPFQSTPQHPPPPPQQQQQPQRPMGYPGNMATPPVQQGAYPPPPPLALQPGQTPDELIRQVLSLDEETISKLGANEQAQIRALKQQYMAMAR